VELGALSEVVVEVVVGRFVVVDVDVNGDVHARSNASTITITNEEGRPPLGHRPSR